MINFSVITGDKTVGHLSATKRGDTTTIDYQYSDNGRGPAIKEVLRTSAAGLPVDWSIQGFTKFGSKIEEHFTQNGDSAEWLDSTGKGSATIRNPAIYIDQGASPYSAQILARALLRVPGMSLPALPSGTVRLERKETFPVHGTDGEEQVTRYDIVGISLDPLPLLLDSKGDLFAASLSPIFIVVRQGYEGEQQRLRKLAAQWQSERFASIEKQVAHHYAGPVRIRNVRVFDPKTSALTEPVAVLVDGREIAAVEPLDSPMTPGETVIDGAGGTLIAGMYEMHAHLQESDALLNLMAGITTVRDMGNTNVVLTKLVDRIDSAEIGGPHVIRSGFIEGKSPFSANNGIIVDSQDKAIDAVRWYGAHGFWQIKIYNSVNPAWVPALVKEAHELGMRVAGHVPAFATADQMIQAGYDEMTRIFNQFHVGLGYGSR